MEFELIIIEGYGINYKLLEIHAEKSKIIHSLQFIVSYWYDDEWQAAFSDNATKIKWIIPGVAPGESGSVSFIVKVK